MRALILHSPQVGRVRCRLVLRLILVLLVPVWDFKVEPSPSISVHAAGSEPQAVARLDVWQGSLCLP
jgi:hypothetical protein